MQKIALLFPGQGSQAVGMGKSFIENFSLAKQMVSDASDKLGFDMKEILLEQTDKLELTAYSQPAILLTSLIAYRVFEAEFAIKPAFAIGHSLGEVTAVAASGALSDMDAVWTVHQRGLFMQEACAGAGAGMMVVMGLDDDKVASICADSQASGKKVWAANYNADGQIVLAGTKADLESVESVFKEAGAKRCLPLAMSVASHCPILSPAAEKLGVLLNDLMKDSFAFDIISNVTAKPYNTKAEAVDLLSKQLTSSVLYKQSIKATENDIDIYIEFGHGNVLSGLNKRGSIKPTKNVNDAQTLTQVIEELAK